MSPEAALGGTAVQSVQSDIYSCGVLLFEMFHPFDTMMERVDTLSKLRCKDIVMPSEAWATTFHQQSDLIRQMLDHDPDNRPSAQALRRMLPASRASETYNRDLIEELECKVETLESQLNSARGVIASLQKELAARV